MRLRRIHILGCASNPDKTHIGQETLLDFEDHVSLTYQSTVEKLDNDAYRDFTMSPKTFYEIIDTLTTCESIDKINVIYDEQSERIRIVEFWTWRSKMLESGIDEIISKIQSGYLDYYEEFLLRKLASTETCPYTFQTIKERLSDYYRFVVCFDLDPCVKDMRYQDHPKTERVYDMYRTIKNELRKTDETKVKREVARIIRRNCKANIIELNKKNHGLDSSGRQFQETCLRPIYTHCEPLPIWSCHHGCYHAIAYYFHLKIRWEIQTYLFVCNLSCGS